VAPRSSSILATSDFPLAMFPVSPMRSICHWIEVEPLPCVGKIGISSKPVTRKLLLLPTESKTSLGSG
jgi:hypothetical protein